MWIQVTGIDLIEITLNLFWCLKHSTSLVSCRSMISGKLFLAMLLKPSCHMPVSHLILSFHSGDSEAHRGERTTVKWGGGGGEAGVKPPTAFSVTKSCLLLTWILVVTRDRLVGGRRMRWKTWDVNQLCSIQATSERRCLRTIYVSLLLVLPPPVLGGEVGPMGWWYGLNCVPPKGIANPQPLRMWPHMETGSLQRRAS